MDERLGTRRCWRWWYQRRCQALGQLTTGDQNQSSLGLPAAFDRAATVSQPSRSRLRKSTFCSVCSSILVYDSATTSRWPSLSAAPWRPDKCSQLPWGLAMSHDVQYRPMPRLPRFSHRPYKFCYPPTSGGTFVSPLAQEMIDRRREKMTLDALEELVTFVRGVREERKAILVVTEGWRLFGRNAALMNETSNGVPGVPPIGVDPATGKLSTRGSSDPRVARSDCDRDRMTLSQSDHEQQFLRLLDEANRANASFYPVDPRGLPVFDSPIGPDPPPPSDVDAAMLRTSNVVAHPRGINRGSGACQHQSDCRGTEANRRGSLFVLPAGLLCVQREARRAISQDRGPCEAAGRAGARPTRIRRSNGNRAAVAFREPVWYSS
jgi:hypothetical protein